MPHRYPRIMNFLAGQVWGILPEKFQQIVTVLEIKAGGGSISAEEIEAAISGARHSNEVQSQGAIGVLPLYGTISNRAGMISEASGGTSVETFQRNFRAFVSDPGISAIVLDVDSPGGTVCGVGELADEIFAARETKPIVAMVNDTCASAALFIASAADKIVVIPSAWVGSIGCFSMHVDESAFDEKQGFNVTLISAGEFKTEGNPFEPLGEEAHAALQKDVNFHYRRFVEAVALGRGVSVAHVEENFGQGRMLNAPEALTAGLIDSIGSMDDVLADLGVNKISANNSFTQQEKPPERRAVVLLDQFRL